MMPYARGYARAYLECGNSRREVTDVDVERRNGYDFLRATTVEGTTLTGRGLVVQGETETGALLVTLFCAPWSFVIEESAGFSTRYYDDGEIIDGSARPAPPMLPTPD